MRRALPLLLCVCGAASAADTNLVKNGSFDAVTMRHNASYMVDKDAHVQNWKTGGTSAGNGWGDYVVSPAWAATHVFDENYDFRLPAAFPDVSPEGGNFVLSDIGIHHGEIRQMVTGLVVGQTYRLSFYQAFAQDYRPWGKPEAIDGQWQVSFGDSSMLAAQMSADGRTGAFSTWALQSFEFVAGSSSQQLTFLSRGTGETGVAGLDGVRLYAVPEASTWAMLAAGLGLIGAAALRRRS